MNKKKTFLALGVLALLVVAGFVFMRYRIDRFTWYDDAVKKEYKKMNWQEGDFSAISGLDIKYQAREVRTEKCATEEELGYKDYLRVEGGMCPMPVKLMVLDKGKGKEVSGVAGLLAMLGKIDNAEKAVTLVILTTPDVKRNSESLVPGRVVGSDAGYLVEYAVRNTFGCGVHQPTKQIVLVTESGEIKLVASEKENPFSGLEICVD